MTEVWKLIRNKLKVHFEISESVKEVNSESSELKVDWQ